MIIVSKSKNSLVFFILMLVSVQACTQSKEYSKNRGHDKFEINYSIVIANHLDTRTLENYYCFNSDVELASEFKIIKTLKGNLNSDNQIINAINCDHYSIEPFNLRKFDEVYDGYEIHWLLLLTKKEGNFYIEESQLLATLKSGKLVYCNAFGKSKIQDIMGLSNSFIGETIGSPIPVNEEPTQGYFQRSSCYSIKDDYAYFNYGVILDVISAEDLID